MLAHCEGGKTQSSYFTPLSRASYVQLLREIVSEAELSGCSC